MKYKNDAFTACNPGHYFVPVSVTGGRCEQMCEHCKGKYLQGMEYAESPGDIISTSDRILNNNGTGILVSGGCDRNGTVPLMNRTDEIRYASDSGLLVNVHAGFITKEEAGLLVKAGVKRFSVDIHQNPAIIRHVLNLDHDPDSYSQLIDNIREAGGVPIPHITAGFGFEDLALSAELVRDKGIKEVVLLALIPTKGTMTEDADMTDDTVLQAVNLLHEMGLEVTLGCMRPRHLRDLEKKCLMSGVRCMANPSPSTIVLAKEMGLDVIEKRVCCCFHSSFTP